MNERKPTPLRDLLEPPPHVQKRCGAHSRTTGQPCRKWATTGRNRCRLHGGAKGSGRPATSGKHTGHALRMRRFMYVVRLLLARYYDKPEQVDAPPGSCDIDAVIEQAILARLLAARSAGTTAPPDESRSAGAPTSPKLLEREIAGAEAGLATLARLRPADPEQIDAASDTSAIGKPASARAAPSTRRTPRASRSSASRAPQRAAGESGPRHPR